MTTDLDRAIRSSLSDIIDAAPQPDDQPAARQWLETPVRRLRSGRVDTALDRVAVEAPLEILSLIHI